MIPNVWGGCDTSRGQGPPILRIWSPRYYRRAPSNGSGATATGGDGLAGEGAPFQPRATSSESLRPCVGTRCGEPPSSGHSGHFAAQNQTTVRPEVVDQLRMMRADHRLRRVSSQRSTNSINHGWSSQGPCNCRGCAKTLVLVGRFSAGAGLTHEKLAFGAFHTICRPGPGWGIREPGSGSTSSPWDAANPGFPAGPHTRLASPKYGHCPE